MCGAAREPNTGGSHGASTEDDEGRDLYALRKQIPEPVVRHHQIGDGLPAVHAARDRPVRGEWRLVTMAWNIKRMFVLCPQQ